MASIISTCTKYSGDEMILRPKFTTKIPIEAECITPDSFSGKSAQEIGNLRIFVGNKQKMLGEVFDIAGGPGSDDEIVVEGDVSNVKHIGAEMSFGKLTIRGDVGMHLGRGMKGGEIVVHGGVGDWAGAEMREGVMMIKGDVGNFLGAAYRGSKSGMRGGTIVVSGDAGHEIGEFMRRGVIAVAGNISSFAGAHMKGGTILCFGKMGERAGGEMDRGTIVAFKEIERLPTFRYELTYNPIFLRVFLKKLMGYGLPIKQEHISGMYDRYRGDLAALGKGEILVWRGA